MPYWRLFYHVVWSTRGREPWLVGERTALAERAIRHRMREVDVFVHGLAVMPGHVHVAVSIPPGDRSSYVVQQMKGSSSYLVGAQDATARDEGFAWQKGYAVLSLSERALLVVLEYIANQHVRHEANDLRRGLEPWNDDAMPPIASLVDSVSGVHDPDNIV